MARIDTTGSDQRGGVAPPAPTDETQGAAAGAADTLTTCSKPAPRLRRTKGGAGFAAGSTPKKSYRPATSSRPRPAGKKPDSGPR